MAVRKGRNDVETKEVRVESQMDGYHQQLLAEGRGNVVLRVGPTVGRHEAPDVEPVEAPDVEPVEGPDLEPVEVPAPVAEEASDDDSVAAK